MAATTEKSGERQLIAPGTEILNGAFVGSGAIVVDFAENPEPYECGYSMIERLLERSDDPTPMEIGFAANNVVSKLVPYSEEKAGQVLRAEAVERGTLWIDREDEVNLSLFIGGGICHHQTLFGSALIRLLQERQDIGGIVSVGMAPLAHVTEPDRHIWTSYKRDDQEVIIDYSSAPHVVMVNEPEELAA